MRPLTCHGVHVNGALPAYPIVEADAPLGDCQTPAPALPRHSRGTLLEVWGSTRPFKGGQSVYKSRPWEWRGPLRSPVQAVVGEKDIEKADIFWQ
jgi:hypothetical protein